MGSPPVESQLVESQLVELLRRRGWTVAAAESLTAGLVCSLIADVPGCSDVFTGGVVAYSPAVKGSVLSVTCLDAGLVSSDVARAMASGVRHALGSSVGIATTGAAGPSSHDGAEAGSVWVAVETPERAASEFHRFTGDRRSIREQGARAALALAMDLVQQT
ncbi:MAG: CinA family protein [Candidatus Nanopelagicales bacterium]|jgi:nicotinamide-nucleotide amidase|nr:CinA family protein [Candidatus Nanopelagicales bacterium]